MSYKSIIDKITYLPNSSTYNIIFKSIDVILKCTLQVKISDAKNIVLANEKIKSDRLKTYDLFLDMISLVKIKINEIHITKTDSNINSFMYINYKNKKHKLELSYIDGIIISMLSLSPLYIHEDLFSDFSHKLDLTENNYTISPNDTLNKLKKSLKIFINNEEYESAAIIRDKINKISN